MKDQSTKPVPSLWRALFVATSSAAVVLVALGFQPLRSELYWWHIALGEMIATWERIPDQQLFVFTIAHDIPAVYDSWLGSVTLARLHGLAGPELNLLVRNLLCGLSAGLVAFFVARRTDRLLPPASVTLLIGVVSFLFVETGPAALALVPVTVAMISIFAVFERPERYWPAAVVPATVLAIINIDLATALVILLTGLVGALHLARMAGRATDSAPVILSAILLALGVPALFGFVYGPSHWAVAVTSLEATNFIAPIAVFISLVTAALLIDRGPELPSTPILAALLVVATAAATVLQPGVPTRIPIITTLHDDVRSEAPLAGTMMADLPLRCAEHLRRTGRELRIFHDQRHAGFLLYHIIDPHRPHSLLFDDHRGLLDDETLEMEELIRSEPVARGFFPQLGINAAIVDATSDPVLAEELGGAPEWHDLTEGFGRYSCFILVDSSPQ